MKPLKNFHEGIDHNHQKTKAFALGMLCGIVPFLIFILWFGFNYEVCQILK